MKQQTIILTGGIASGKTLVSDFLETLNAHAIDTDFIARSLLNKETKYYSSEAFCRIKVYFGQKIFNQDVLDRKKLREIIFNDQNARRYLESILHPLIFDAVKKELNQNCKSYDLVSVPLLTRNSSYLGLADKILVVEVDPIIQLVRVMLRDKINEALAQSIINTQVTNQERRSLADTIIINTNMCHTKNILKQLDKKYSVARK